MCHAVSTSNRIKVILIVLTVFMLQVYAFSAETASIPSEVKEWQQSAAAFERAGNTSDAHSTYEKIIQGYPNTPYGLEACINHARLFVKQKKYQNLLPVVEAICTNFSEQPGVLGGCSDLIEDCMYANAHVEAVALCSQVQTRLASHPRITLAIGWEGMVYANQGNDGAARQKRQELLQKEDCIASDFLDAMSAIGWGYYCAGLWDQALETYRLGLDRDSTHKNAVHLQYQIVKTCLTQKNITAARQEMETLLTKYAHRANTPGLACRLAKDYRKRGFQKEAIALYETLLERFSEHADVPVFRDALVETYADMGDLENAQQALSEDIEACPHRRELLRMITRVAVETARDGQTDSAREWVDAIFSQNPEGPDQLFGYTTLARVYVHQGRNEEAAATVNEALALFKDYPGDLTYHLFGVGEEYYLKAISQLGRSSQSILAYDNLAKAIAAWESVLEAVPASAHRAKLLYFTGMAYWLQQSYADALVQFMRLTSESPNDRNAVQAMNFAGRCYLKLYDQKYLTSAEMEEGLETVLGYLVSVKNTDSMGEFVWTLGQLKFENQQWQDAVKYLSLCRDYVSRESQKIVMLDYQLGQAYEHSGDNKKAMQHYLSYLDKVKTDDVPHLVSIHNKIRQLNR